MTARRVSVVPVTADGSGAGTVHITNAEKVWWPDENLTKADVARYYARVAGRLLPWTVDRPLTAERCPDGFRGRCFYQKNFAMAAKLGLPKSPDAIYQRLGTGGVDFPALIRVLRDRNYDGWISLDFNYVDMPPGVTIEQDMTAHRKYLVDTLHATMKR